MLCNTIFKIFLFFILNFIKMTPVLVLLSYVIYSILFEYPLNCFPVFTFIHSIIFLTFRFASSLCLFLKILTSPLHRKAHNDGIFLTEVHFGLFDKKLHLDCLLFIHLFNVTLKLLHTM